MIHKVRIRIFKPKLFFVFVPLFNFFYAYAGMLSAIGKVSKGSIFGFLAGISSFIVAAICVVILLIPTWIFTMDNWLDISYKMIIVYIIMCVLALTVYFFYKKALATAVEKGEVAFVEGQYYLQHSGTE